MEYHDNWISMSFFQVAHLLETAASILSNQYVYNEAVQLIISPNFYNEKYVQEYFGAKYITAI